MSRKNAVVVLVGWGVFSLLLAGCGPDGGTPVESVPGPVAEDSGPGRNWAGNLVYSAAEIHRPATVEELQVVLRMPGPLKVVGSRHSFSDVANTEGHLISMERFNRVLSLDPDVPSVTLEAGVRYGELAEYLQERGYALHNLASLPHISVVGAAATATHGSGVANGNLATSVLAMEIVKADGQTVRLSRANDGDVFAGAVVHLGALGVVTSITLAIEPTFDVEQYVYEHLTIDRLDAGRFDGLMAEAYSVSFFTDWGETINQVWLKHRMEPGAAAVEPAADLFGATLADRDLHPVVSLSAEPCTPQMGVRGPWHERLPHFRMGFRPSTGAELQTEIFVPREHAFAAFQAIHALRDSIRPMLQISEIRAVAADDLWMSPAYGQDVIAFHFTWKADGPGVMRVIPVLEAALRPFEARPHWGKLSGVSSARLAELYPRLDDFRKLVREYDPDGRFRNAYLNHAIFGDE